MEDDITEPGYGAQERRREARFQPPASLRLRLRPPGLLGWFKRRERALLDCSQSGIAWLEPVALEVGSVVFCDLEGAGWRLRGLPGRVRTVDRLVRDFRVGFEFSRGELSEARARQLSLALAQLDSGTLGG
ncbi:MAG: PilZ domain-containing protein [Gammaproteobacteria bacterium]|nr:PilZ domain-containing protein [Gammaproteobacteria bacterium]